MYVLAHGPNVCIDQDRSPLLMYEFADFLTQSPCVHIPNFIYAKKV